MPTATLRRLPTRKQRLLHPPAFDKAKFVDIQRHWRRLGPLFKSEAARKIWAPCMLEFANDRAENSGFAFVERFPHTLPSHYDSCDWRFCPEVPRRGPLPAFWDYACHSACHWVVDLCLFVARSAYPKQPWRILYSNAAKSNHSTVWNGDLQHPLLFDVNFSAIGVSPKEALQLAWHGRELQLGEYLKGYCHAR